MLTAAVGIEKKIVDSAYEISQISKLALFIIKFWFSLIQFF